MKLFEKKLVKKPLRKQNDAQFLGNLYRSHNNGESDCCSGAQSSPCNHNGDADCCNNKPKT